MKIQQKPVNIGSYNANEITLENSSGISISFLTYAGIITKFIAPDKNGNFENIVLSLKNYSDYIENTSMIGAIVGRTSDIIYNAHLNIDNKDIFLTKNYGIHHINGGVKNFSKKLFDYEFFIESDIISVELKLKSCDLEEGYPGNSDISIIYSLDETNNFKIEYRAFSDETTLMNLSNHIYFNLSGNNSQDIMSESILIPADYFYEIDEEKIITGKIKKTFDTPFDFKKLKEIGTSINSDDDQIRIRNGYDHCFLFNFEDANPTCTLYDSNSMRSLNITTNHLSLCLNTQNQNNNDIFEYNSDNNIRRGVCLQFQSPPIGYNQCNKEKSILKKGHKYNKFVNYHFRLI